MNDILKPVAKLLSLKNKSAFILKVNSIRSWITINRRRVKISFIKDQRNKVIFILSEVSLRDLIFIKMVPWKVDVN